MSTNYTAFITYNKSGARTSQLTTNSYINLVKMIIEEVKTFKGGFNLQIDRRGKSIWNENFVSSKSIKEELETIRRWMIAFYKLHRKARIIK